MAAISSISNGEAMSSVRTKLNSVITEINLLDPTDWVDYSATSTIVGWSSFTYKELKYRIIGKQMFVEFFLYGTSNSTTTSFTLPNNMIGVQELVIPTLSVNNGVAASQYNYTRIQLNNNLVQSYTSFAGAAWTASGTKQLNGSFFIQIA